MLKNAYLLAKIGADTAKNVQLFAEILPIGRHVADLAAAPLASAGNNFGDTPGGGGPRA